MDNGVGAASNAPLGSNQRLLFFAVVWLLAIHTGMLAYAATRHSPTALEPAFLVAGLSHWEFGRFELFRVNPPLVRMVAALPVLAAGYDMDWSSFDDRAGARPEFQMGADFIKANGERSIWLFTIARWVCIPFSLIGALFCFFWSRELWGHNGAGLISLILWCFEPNVLAHGELITTDCATTSFGVGAGYFFWRWLKHRTWERAGITGLLFGFAQLSKLSWLLLYGLWPVLWLFWMWSEHRCRRGLQPPHEKCIREHAPAGIRLRTSALQLASVLLIGLCLTNLGYAFDGTGSRLGEFTFVSHALGGEQPGTPTNRFAESALKSLPLPVPSQYVLGFDVQKKDFEDFAQPSYLRGEWRQGGWWYYYLYGLAVKTPHGSQAMLALAVFALIVAARRSSTVRSFEARDLVILVTPPLALFVLVSSQLEFNQHMRYVLPVLGFVFVFMGVGAYWLRDGYRLLSGDPRPCRLPLRLQFPAPFFPAPWALGFRFVVVASLLAAVASTVHAYPHQLAYFNELAGGPANGWRHLLDSNFDAHQDVLYAAAWQRNHPADSQPFYWLSCPYDPRYVGMRGVDLEDVNWRDVLAKAVHERAAANVLLSKQVLVEQADSLARFELEIIGDVGATLVALRVTERMPCRRTALRRTVGGSVSG